MTRVLTIITTWICNRIKAITDWGTQLKDSQEEQPRNYAATIAWAVIFTIMFLIITAVWSVFVTPNIDMVSARWVLSAQTQATAAILGLLIAAIVFRWRRVSSDEQELLSNIHCYLKEIGNSWLTVESSQAKRVIDLTYEQYLNWVNTEMGKATKKVKLDDRSKQILENLGRLWAIRELSYAYVSLGEESLERTLTYGQMKPLAEINDFCKESAIHTWEAYFTNYANFTLYLFKALQQVFRTLREQEIIKNPKKLKNVEDVAYSDYQLLNNIRNSIITDNGKIISEQIRIVRSSLRPVFYITCVILVLAIILGWVVLSGLGENIQTTFYGGFIGYLVLVPIVMSIFGLLLATLTVFYAVR